MAPPFLRFQTEEFRLGTQRKAELVEESDSILEKQSRFRSVGAGESEVVYAYLYSNQWELVNQNEISPGGNKLIYDLRDLKKAYFHMSLDPILIGVENNVSLVGPSYVPEFY
jgi:hypothetical protein